ncbi:MAG: AAA family ATPase [Methylophilaceae bacterium]|nr:AAA family ATPase [Methylophilaceae bacterium]
MLEQAALNNNIRGEFSADIHAMTDEQLEAMRAPLLPGRFVGPILRANPVGSEAYQALKNRLVDEMAHQHLKIKAVANMTRPGEMHREPLRWEDLLKAWESGREDLWDHGNYYKSTPSLALQVESALQQWVKALDTERAGKLQTPGFVETSIFKKMLRAFRMAQDECELVEVAIAPGSGKTTSTGHYLKEMRKASGLNCPIWKIKLGESNIGLKLIMQEILGAMHGADNGSEFGGMSQSAMKYAIEERAKKHPVGLLIIDEAQHIGNFIGTNGAIHGLNIINGLREFCDDRLFGVVLLGNGEIYQRVKKSRNSIQLASRMEAWRVSVGNPTEADIDLIMESWGVSGKSERELSVKLGTQPGGLRTLVNFYRRALCEFDEITQASLNAVSKG